VNLSTSRLATVAAIAGAALGGAGVANAVTKRTANQAAPSGTAARHGNPNETALSGDTLASASDAAIAANAGAKVVAATTEDPAENTAAAYEVHITKADGTRATVLEDSAFKVLSTGTDEHRGGFGHHGQNPNEKALTGDTLSQAKAAVKAALSGATIDSATAEDPTENTGAAYEVHAHTSNGEVTVLLDKSFKVVKQETHTGRHR
jgi:uncharacterized membrane protein YkoI